MYNLTISNVPGPNVPVYLCGARLLALTSGGAIPEVADYRVVLDPEDTILGSARRHLDLRDLFTQRQGLHQSGQVLRESGEPLEKHFTALNVGEIRLLALAKPRQYPALLVDVLDAQPGAASIGPLRPPERGKHLLRHYPADAFEVVEQLPLLGSQLSRRCQMLQ